MDTCEFTRRKLSAYLDGELPEAHAAEVRAHLALCDACAAYHDNLLAVDSLLDDVAAIPVDDRFTRDVLARLRTRRAQPVWIRLSRALASPLPRWAVAAVLIIAIGLGSGLALVAQPGAGLPTTADQAPIISRQFGLDVFDDLPGDTIGGAYLQVVGAVGGDRS